MLAELAVNDAAGVHRAGRDRPGATSPAQAAADATDAA